MPSVESVLSPGPDRLVPRNTTMPMSCSTSTPRDILSQTTTSLVSAISPRTRLTWLVGCRKPTKAEEPTSLCRRCLDGQPGHSSMMPASGSEGNEWMARVLLVKEDILQWPTVLPPRLKPYNRPHQVSAYVATRYVESIEVGMHNIRYFRTIRPSIT